MEHHNIFINIVRSSSGQGLNSNITTTILSSLNESFEEAGIRFNLLGTDYIDNDNYYTNVNGKVSQLFNERKHSNAIDIYVLGINTIWATIYGDITGQAQGLPSSAMIVHGGYYSQSTLPHEMEHCLGLYHTHHGTVNEGGGGCPELVDGSNSSSCGDYITDTPADPNIWTSCFYTGNIRDTNGQMYNPDPSNMMSYAGQSCRIKFTPKQIERIKDFITKTPILQNAIYSTLSINGADVVCQTANYSISNLPTSATVSWSLSSGSGAPYPVLQQNGNTCIVSNTYNFVTSVKLTANISYGGLNYQLERYISTDTNNGKQEGTYSQKPCSFYGVTHPALSGKLTGQAIFVHQGCEVTVALPSMYGKICRLADNSTAPTKWFYSQTNHELYFELPLGSGGIPFHFTIEGNGMCQSKDLLFFSMSNNLSAFSVTMVPNPTKEQCVIQIEVPDKAERDISVYKIEIFDMFTGVKMKGIETIKDTYILDTSNWSSGPYVLCVSIGDDVIVKKLLVQH